MLGKKEFSSILINLITIKMLLSYPMQLIKTSANAAWIQMIFVTLIALGLFFVTVKVYERKISIIEIASIRGKKPLKTAVGMIVFLVLLANIVTVMRIFPESVKIILLQDTDTRLLVGVFALTVLISARYGIEAIGRVSYILLPVCGIIFVLFVFLLIPYYKISNITPILGSGAVNVFVKGINGLSMFSDIIMLNILIGFAKNIKEAKQSGYRAIIIGGAIGTLIMLMYALIYPYPVSENFIFPVYQITRVINLGSFFNRFEAIFQFIWSMLIFIYGAVYIFGMCFVWQTTFNLKYLKPLVLPMIILSAGCSLLPESINEVIKISEILGYVIYPVVFLLPIAIGVMDKIKNKKTQESECEA